jgi:hypothetical protein
MRIRCLGTIVLTNKFWSLKVFESLVLRYIASSYYLQFYINRTYPRMILGA